MRLRPPDIEELGLALSLESLVASWNSFEKGRTRFDMTIIGEVDDLPSSVCASLYRVAQEAITNAAKHAQAGRVQLRLEAAQGDIVLSVEDDGNALDRHGHAAPGGCSVATEVDVVRRGAWESRGGPSRGL